MNILQLNHRIPFPLNDGGNIATWYVTKHLKDLGHKVTFACVNTNKHYQDPSVMADVTHDIISRDINTDIKPFPALKAMFGKTPYNVIRFYSRQLEAEIVKKLQTEKFDIVHLEGIHLGPYIKAIKKHTNAPIVLRTHNIEHMIWERVAKNEKNKARAFYLKQLSRQLKKYENKCFEQANGIVAITEQDAEFIRNSKYAGPVETINAGVDLDRFKPGKDEPERKSLCMLGSMEWQPNIQAVRWFLNSVWPKLYAEDPELELHIAGKKTPREFLDLKIAGVTVHGEVASAAEFLQTYEVLVVPLLSGGGMRLKVVEAMAAGKCVVSTSIGAEGINYSNGENILIADSAADLHKTIIQAMRTPGRIQTIGKNARALAEREYDWKRLVLKFDRFYKTLQSGF